MFLEFGPSLGITSLDGAEKLFGLTAKLLEVGADREVTIVQLPGHNGPPSGLPGPQRGRKEVRQEPWISEFAQVDSVLSADGRRPVRRRQYTTGREGTQSSGDQYSARRKLSHFPGIIFAGGLLSNHTPQAGTRNGGIAHDDCLSRN